MAFATKAPPTNSAPGKDRVAMRVAIMPKPAPSNPWPRLRPMTSPTTAPAIVLNTGTGNSNSQISEFSNSKLRHPELVSG
jgi:hypothetical protein